METGKQLGPYKILGPAGAGGMGEVYRARDTRLEREVAIKVLHTQVADDPDLKARFEREAKAISSLNHPNICTLYDIGSEDGHDYLVMEYLEGETLTERLSRGPLQTAELLEIAVQVADALDKAHRQGLVHRDLKPGNVMLTKHGSKLLDFGLAKLQPESGVVMDITSAETRTTPLTTQGAIIGTLQYMSPEQLEGQEATACSDIFAFGAMLYEMASGSPAFDGKSKASLIAAVLKEQPRSVSEIQPLTPLSLELVIKQCLAKDPEQRWQSAGDLKRSLVLISEGGSIAGVVGAQNAPKRPARLPWILTGLLTVIATIFGYFLWQSPEETVRASRLQILEPQGGTFSKGAGGAVALSPDGNKLAFLADDTSSGLGENLIWVRDINSIDATPLRGTSGATFPFWSPDSKYIAFFSGNRLMKVPTGGGAILTICEATNGRGGSWSKNGVIIFSPTMSGQLYRVDAGGGEPEIALSLDTVAGDYTHRYPSFLPDGDHYLYFARTMGEAGGERDAICVASLSDRSGKRLINARSTAEYSDGHIIYLQESILMAQPFNLQSLELAGDAIPLAEGVTYLPEWSRGVFSSIPEGMIVYRLGTVNLNTILLAYDSKGTVIDTIGDPARQNAVAVSPDGMLIAIDAFENNSPNPDIWTYDRRRSLKSRVTFTDFVDNFPVWSPDGKRLLFHRQEGERHKLYIKDISGANVEELVFEDTLFIIPNDWTADGRYVLFQRLVPGGDDIYAVDLQSDNELFSILVTDAWEWAAQVSPDGKWLAYTSNRSGRDEVYITSFPESSGKWQVSGKGGATPKWSADGTRLFYVTPEYMIVSVIIDGSGSNFSIGQTDNLFVIHPGSNDGYYEVYGNGKNFIVNSLLSGEPAKSFVLMQNWRAGLN